MKILSSAPIVALTALAFVAPTGAANDLNCYGDRYVVVPLGAGYLDMRGFFFVTPWEPYRPTVWLYAEAGGDPGNLDRGDDVDVMGTPSDAGYCGRGLLPPVVDDLMF